MTLQNYCFITILTTGQFSWYEKCYWFCSLLPAVSWKFIEFKNGSEFSHCSNVLFQRENLRSYVVGLDTPEVRCPARRMLVSAREWRNNASQVALPTLLLVTKAISNARGAGRSLAFKTRWRMCFSVFCTSHSGSFVFMQTFFLLLTNKTRTAVKVICLLISVQFLFFHALWMAIFLSFYFSQQ